MNFQPFRLAAILAAAAITVPAADPLPSAESLLDRHIEASGGKAAYASLKNLSLTGKIELSEAGMSGTLTTISADPDLSRTTVEFPGAGRFESGTGGGRAWQMNPVQGPRLLEGEELKRALRLYQFNAALVWRDLYSKVVTEAEEDAGGKPCYRVSMTGKDGGAPDVAWYDKQSGLVTKTRISLITPQGELTLESEVGDYRDVSGIKLPFAITQKAGPQAMKVAIAEAKVNAELPPGTFDPPEENRKLIK